MHNPPTTSRSLLIGFFALAVFTATAGAHHGWNWAQDAQTEMTGEILDIYIGPPHPRLQIRTADEGEWQVDLGNPRQTADAGFAAGEAQVGDKVLVRGHRSAKTGERLIKAVRITVDEKQYLFYPDLLRE